MSRVFAIGRRFISIQDNLGDEPKKKQKSQPVAVKSEPKPKSEKVTFRHGKIRVSVTGAKEVSVSEDGKTMKLSISPEHLQQ